MEPGAGGDGAEPRCQVAAQPREDAFATGAVDLVATADVLVQVAFAEKPRQCPLQQGRAVPVAEVLGHAGGLQHGGRQYGVAQAQLGQQGLGKGPHIGHQAMAVEALQRLRGWAVVAELAVVVVFDDQRTQLGGPCQQGVPAWLAHRHAQRELVRGRHVDQPSAVGDLFHAQAFIVHRYRLQARAQRQEQLPRWRVARVFHGHLATRLDQYPGDQVQSLLGAVAHQQVGGAAVHAAGVGDVMGNGLAQLWQALGRELPLGVALAAAQGIVQATAPLVERELRLARGPADEVVT
ncbi:hypothetical protein D3C81_1207610 [compost metagenome]